MAIYFIYSFYYRPQRIWGKVIFSQACVILFTGRSASVHAGIPDSPDQTPLNQAQPPPKTRHPPGAGTPNAVHAGRYGQRPAEVRSCFYIFLFILFFSLCSESAFQVCFPFTWSKQNHLKRKCHWREQYRKSLSIFTNSSQIFRLKRHTTGS